MSRLQIELLQKLIAAERYYFRACVAARPDRFVSPDIRLVEVGTVNGVQKRTAQSLIDSGLAEAAVKSDDTYNRWYIRLASGVVNHIETPEQYD